VGSVDLDDTDGTVDIVVSFDENGIPIIDIEFFDLFGNPITQFEDPVEICFNLEFEFNLNNACLAFFNERTGKFECQDECLYENNNGVCGETDHFTSFSILFQSGIGDDCGSDDPIDYLLLYLSAGFFFFYFCIVFISLLGIESGYRVRRAYNNSSTEPRVVVIS